MILHGALDSLLTIEKIHVIKSKELVFSYTKHFSSMV
ncbi:hypothetical protein SAMN04487776_1278 [Priestia megaterium]|nr:hypothetical protein SAMN04487776_1278 [Priestia megaterium]